MLVLHEGDRVGHVAAIVHHVLVDEYGGIVRCDRVANGVIQAVKELNLNVGVVVRLQGTNVVTF